MNRAGTAEKVSAKGMATAALQMIDFDDLLTSGKDLLDGMVQAVKTLDAKREVAELMSKAPRMLLGELTEAQKLAVTALSCGTTSNDMQLANVEKEEDGSIKAGVLVFKSEKNKNQQHLLLKINPESREIHIRGSKGPIANQAGTNGITINKLDLEKPDLYDLILKRAGLAD